MPKTLPDNELEAGATVAQAQGGDWVTLSIAVRPDLKRRIWEASRQQQVRPSQLSRMILLDGIARMEAAA